MSGKQTVFPAVNTAVAEVQRRHPIWTRARSLSLVLQMMSILVEARRFMPPTMSAWDVAESLELAGLAIREHGATFAPTGRTLQIVRKIDPTFLAHTKGSTRRAGRAAGTTRKREPKWERPNRFNVYLLRKGDFIRYTAMTGGETAVVERSADARGVHVRDVNGRISHWVSFDLINWVAPTGTSFEKRVDKKGYSFGRTASKKKSCGCRH